MIQALSASAFPLSVDMLGKLLEENEKDSITQLYIAETLGYTYRALTKNREYPRFHTLIGKGSGKVGKAEAARICQNTMNMLQRFAKKGGEPDGNDPV